MKNSKGYQNRGDILIVDDELSSLRTLSDILTAEGYGVRGAPDGSTALMIVENAQPELILLDVRMPEMDGFEVCRQIKADEKSSAIPVFFLSALDETADKVKGFAAGGLDFITKPFQAEEVLARIDSHLTLSRLSNNLEEQIAERTDEIKLYKYIVESTNNPIGLVDRNLIYLNVNESYCQALKKSASAIIGHSVPELFGRNFFETVMEPHYKQCFAGENVNYQDWFDFPGWGRRYMDVRYYPFREAGGRVAAVVTNVHDITEIKQNEQKLQNAYSEIQHNEQVLAKQLEFERLIADIASQLAQTSPEQLDESIESTLQALGLFFGTQRAFLAQFTNDGKSLFHRKIWSAEGIDVPPYYFEMDMATASPWFAQQVRLGKAINTGPGLVNLPDESGVLRERLKRDGVNSGVIVPVRVEDRSLGMLGLDTVDQPRDFPTPLVDRLKIVANTVGSTIYRVESQTALQSSQDQIRKLSDRLEQENIYLRNEIEINYKHDEIVGESTPLKMALGQAEKVASQATCVLIQGETGTGKELFARAIHKMSPRSKRSMLMVNCGALPGTLIESELFGREKGAFTGAVSRESGRFEVADGSTIFLDEISDLPIELQSKLLRVLEYGQFERLGSSKPISVDVRVIAATNHNLKKRVQEGRFRKDLYYRLGAFPINLPPLRERREDIPLLVWTFAGRLGKQMGKTIERISQKTMNLLKDYPWPGNIRELRNVLERAMIMSTDTTLRIDSLGFEDEICTPGATLKQVEKAHILKVLESTGWRVSGKHGAADVLGLKESTLRARMKKAGIKRQRPAAIRNGAVS